MLLIQQFERQTDVGWQLMVVHFKEAAVVAGPAGCFFGSASVWSVSPLPPPLSNNLCVCVIDYVSLHKGSQQHNSDCSVALAVCTWSGLVCSLAPLCAIQHTHPRVSL